MINVFNKKGCWRIITAIIVISFLFSFTGLGQTSNFPIRKISGYVSNFGKPFSGANVRIYGSLRGTVTDARGFYEIDARPGEMLRFSYIGFQNIDIVVEDVTELLNVEMFEIVNQLKEVTVQKKRHGKNDIASGERPKKVKTNFGDIDLRSAGTKIDYVSGDDLNLASVSLGDAVSTKFSNFRPLLSIVNKFKKPIWVIDGVIFGSNTTPSTINTDFLDNSIPFIDLSNVKEIFFLRGLAATVRYGAAGSAGVYVVTTRAFDFSQNTQKAREDALNKVTYQNDAISYENYSRYEPLYISAYDSISSLTEAYKLFENEAYNLQLSPYFGLAVAQKLRARFGENLISNQILETSRNQHADNPEVLKSLAYFLQSQRQYNDALLIYRKLLALRPDYAQSYRDLANSLVETKAYEQAWKTYMQYLNKTGELTESGIDKLVFDEMQGLFNQKRKQLPPEAGMETADPEETQQDVRLVFEWNTSEAEFELEFVNPGKQVFVFDHTYKNNNELFTDEKTKGYSSEKFYIETLGIGQWMVNLTYHGNKKYDPTYLKVNIYYNWGKANQRQETKVFNLLQTGIKTNLLMLSQANLVAQE
jgi:hypothetical protein